jgi:xylan 1,4-beta-xylosidase
LSHGRGTGDAHATVCNPLDLSYRLQDVGRGRGRRVYREAADPSVVLFRDRYYLFPSMSGGFWHSVDLVGWEFVSVPILPFADYAPDVHEVDGRLVVCASKAVGVCHFYRCADPLSETWERIEGDTAFWDPALFQDDDGRLYLYEGCSNRRPIRGVELDRQTFRRIGRPVDLIASHPQRHGWERPGEDWDPTRHKVSGLMRLLGTGPFIEGAWVTKHEGRYYLQYSAPGTEYNTYADGYYLGDSPLGPFRYSAASPFSSKPGGFITGAGHGSTLQDRHGNWWHFATMRISVHHSMERRIGVFPAGFDADGVLFSNQEFGDYPLEIPSEPRNPWSLTGRWMLLSSRRPVKASSAAPGKAAENAVDEDIRTWWQAAGDGSDEWLAVELPEGATVHAVQVNLGDTGIDPPSAPRRERSGFPTKRAIRTDAFVHCTVETSVDGNTWEPLHDASADGSGRTHLYVALEKPRVLRYVRVTGHAQPFGAPLSVTGLRVFGIGSGEPPARVTPEVTRIDALTARVAWIPAPGARGHTVRYGLSPDKLYHCWQVYDAANLDVGSLNAGHSYWFAVDSFNENGLTRGVPVQVSAIEA